MLTFKGLTLQTLEFIHLFIFYHPLSCTQGSGSFTSHNTLSENLYRSPGNRIFNPLFTASYKNISVGLPLKTDALLDSVFGIGQQLGGVQGKN